MLVAVIKHDSINQIKLNKIKSNDYHEIFEYPVQNENLRSQTNIPACRVYVKMSEIHEIGGVRHII